MQKYLRDYLDMYNGEDRIEAFVDYEKVAVLGTNKFKIRMSLYAWSKTGETVRLESEIPVSFSMGDLDINGVYFESYLSEHFYVDTFLPLNNSNLESNLIARCETIAIEDRGFEEYVQRAKFASQNVSVWLGENYDEVCGESFIRYRKGNEGTLLQYRLELIYDEASEIYAAQSTGKMCDTLLLSMVRDSYAYTHELYYEFCGAKEKIADNVTNNYTWTIPDLAALCDNALSGDCKIWCYTYDGNTYCGSSYVEIKLEVPDAAEPSVKGGEIILDTECIILCTRKSQNYTVKLELMLQDHAIDVHTGKTDSLGFKIGYSFGKYFPTQTSINGTLKCSTFNGTAFVGEKSTVVKVSIPENDDTRPKFTAADLTLSPISDLPSAFDGAYIRGKTGIQARMNASSDCSEISSYALSVGSQRATGETAEIAMLMADGDLEVKATATDARGYSTTVTMSIFVHPYRTPKVIPYGNQSSVICERAKENGELTPNGTMLAILAGKRYTGIQINGEERNFCTLRYCIKANGQKEYGAWETLLGDNSEENQISTLIENAVGELKSSYMVQIEAADTLGGSHVLTFQIMTEAVSFVLYDGPDGAAFGKFAEAPNVVDVADHMTLLVRGKLVVVSSDWVDLDTAEMVYPNNIGRNGSMGCQYQVTNGNNVIVAFNCNFLYAGTAMVMNKIPIDEAHRPKFPIYTLCPVSDRGIALVSVGTDGYIRVEWVQSLAEMARTNTTAVAWIDGYLDYWT